MLLTQQFSSPAIAEKTLWPKENVFTIVIIPDLAERDASFEPIINGEESLQQFVQSLGSADIEAEITQGLEFIEDNSPFHPLGFHETESTAAEFHGVMNEHIAIAESTQRHTYQMIQKIKDSTFPKIILNINDKEDLTLLKTIPLHSELAEQIEKLTATMTEDVDTYIFMIPSLELIHDAAQAGIVVQPVYIDSLMSYRTSGQGETTSSCMARDVLEAIDNAFPGHIEDIEDGIAWINDAKWAYKYGTALTSQELAAQSALKFD